IWASRASWAAAMHDKVPAITSYVNQHSSAFCLRRIDGDAHGVVVEAAAGGWIELPAVPRAAEDARGSELVLTWIADDALADGAETDRSAVMRAAIPHSAQLAVHEDDADLPSPDTRDDVPLALEVGDRTDVVPIAHAWARPSRSP